MKERIENLDTYLADFRETKPIEPIYLSPDQRAVQIEAIREGVGLLRFSWEGLNKLYDELESYLEKNPHLPEDQKKILLDFLLRAEGLIHITKTLVKEYSAIWAALRAHELWEMLEGERKRLRAEMRKRKNASAEES